MPHVPRSNPAAVRAPDRGAAAARTLHDDTDRLTRALSARGILVRCEAAEMLGERLAGRGRAPRELLRACADPSWLVRAAAAEALHDIGDPAAGPVLPRLLIDPNPIVRSYAATAVATVIGKPARPRLRAAVARERSSLARVGMSGALVALGDTGQLDVLLGLLGSRQYRVRCAVANTVGSWLVLPPAERTRAVAVLRSALADEDNRAARSTMTRALRALSRPAR